VCPPTYLTNLLQLDYIMIVRHSPRHQLLYLVLYRALYYQVTILIRNSIVLWAGTCCIEHFTTRWQYLLTHSSIVLWAVLVCRFPGSVHVALPQISRWRFYLETRTEMLYLQLFMRSWFLQQVQLPVERTIRVRHIANAQQTASVQLIKMICCSSLPRPDPSVRLILVCDWS